MQNELDLKTCDKLDANACELLGFTQTDIAAVDVRLRAMITFQPFIQLFTSSTLHSIAYVYALVHACMYENVIMLLTTVALAFAYMPSLRTIADTISCTL